VKLELLKQLAEEAREVEQAIRPLMPHMGVEPGYVSNEVWCSANGIADDLERAYMDALSEDGLAQAAMLAKAKPEAVA
jgi:hypothetical protein